MSIIECGDCGKEISSHAARCVHCGFPLPENRPGVKWGRYLVLGLVVLTATTAIILNRETIVDAFEAARTIYAAPAGDSPRRAGATGAVPASATSGLSRDLQPVATAAAAMKQAPDPAAIIRRVIGRDKEIYAAFKALDYEHYWTADDLDLVARCEANRKELLYGLAALHLVDQNPDYELLMDFLQMENRVAMTVIAYYEDLIPAKYARPATPLLVQRLQKAFVEIRDYEVRLEKFGWKRAYAEWGTRR
ncbi:MAG TPA: hypothetical protein PLP29_00300 [Candidatus Ozemobacteraceae bacterium]|nr:hypothetical protein [Candidatus Ozemobacteraceae bacterium]